MITLAVRGVIGSSFRETITRLHFAKRAIFWVSHTVKCYKVRSPVVYCPAEGVNVIMLISQSYTTLLERESDD